MANDKQAICNFVLQRGQVSCREQVGGKRESIYNKYLITHLNAACLIWTKVLIYMHTSSDIRTMCLHKVVTTTWSWDLATL